MTEQTRPDETATGPLRPADGLHLLGEYQGSGFTEPRYLVRRGDGQVIQLSRLLYLITAAITESGADGGWDVARVAERVAADSEREVTAGNIGYLVAGKLAPLGVVLIGPPGDDALGPDAGRRPGRPVSAPRVNLLLGLRIRGTLLRPRAAGAVGGALAWLHWPPLAAVVVAGFAAFEAWLFGVHGVIGPLLGVLRQPVLFLAVAGLTLASLVFHEFGHASACRYGGARPGVVGFGLYLIWPSLYTDVTDAYRLDRAGRLRTDLGGVYFNAILILALSGCYAVTGQPVFLAAAFFDNLQILQQLMPLIRMDGYFILADLAGLPDLLGLLLPIIASLLPGTAARRAAAPARGLRHGPRLLVTVWVLIAVPLLAAVAGYTLWNLPVMATTAARSFTGGLTATRTGFAAGHPAAGLAALLTDILLLIPAAGLAYLLARITRRAATAAIRHATRHWPRRPVPALTAALAALALLAAGLGLGLGLGLTPSPPSRATAAAPATRPQPQSQDGTRQRPAATPTPVTTPAGYLPRVTAPASASAAPKAGQPAATRMAGATAPALTDPGSRSATAANRSSGAAGRSSAAAQRATGPATSPAAQSTAPARSAPAPAQAANPAPSGSAAADTKPAPSPTCAVNLGVSLLQISLLCS